MRGSLLALFAAPGTKARAATEAAKIARVQGRGGGRRGAGEQAVDEMLALARPVLAPPPLSAAELARRRRMMISYGRLTRAQHLESERKVNLFLTAKWAAIDALPQARRAEALRERGEEPPLNSPLWTATPPISKNFNPGDLTSKRKP
jgi:hypothetical protein